MLSKKWYKKHYEEACAKIRDLEKSIEENVRVMRFIRKHNDVLYVQVDKYLNNNNLYNIAGSPRVCFSYLDSNSHIHSVTKDVGANIEINILSNNIDSALVEVKRASIVKDEAPVSDYYLLHKDSESLIQIPNELFKEDPATSFLKKLVGSL